MSKQKFISIRNQADQNILELFFLDVIQDTYDWWTGMMVSQVQQVIDKINFYQPTKIKVIIDSVGGDAPTGLAIYNFLKRHDAKVEVEVIGLAGSIASVIAMAANKGKLKIAKNAFMMIHQCEGVAIGTSEEIRQGAELIDLYTDQAVDIYSQRTGKPKEEIAALFENGDYWMTGDQAVEQGFADETFNDVSDNLQIAARVNPNDYSNLPEGIKALLKPAEKKEETVEDPEIKTFIQNQITDMKKFFTEIVNAIRGVKPAEGTVITNQIADAVSAPFEKLGDEIETTITNKVNETIAGEVVNKAITTQVTNAIGAIDFTVDGPAKTAIENATKLAVQAATQEMNTRVTTLETANADLVKKNTDLETEITQIKGGKTITKEDEKDKPTMRGKWVKG